MLQRCNGYGLGLLIMVILGHGRQWRSQKIQKGCIGINSTQYKIQQFLSQKNKFNSCHKLNF